LVFDRLLSIFDRYRIF